MKKVYTKPLISVEVMSLDEPIAHTCEMNRNDVLDLMEANYFLPDMTCEVKLVLKTGGFDYDGDGIADPDGNDTVCYHSNIQKAFLS